MNDNPMCKECKAKIEPHHRWGYCCHRSVLVVRKAPEGDFECFPNLSWPEADRLLGQAREHQNAKALFEGMRNVVRQGGEDNWQACERATETVYWRLAEYCREFYEQREKLLTIDTLCSDCATKATPEDYVGYCRENGILFVGTEPDRDFFGGLLWGEVQPHLRKVGESMFAGAGQKRLRYLMEQGEMDEVKATALAAEPDLEELRAAIRKLCAEKAAAERDSARH